MKVAYILVLATASSFIINIVIIPLLLNLSHRFKWYDDIDHRKIHTGEIPRIGGIGIFISFLCGILIFYLLILFTADQDPSAFFTNFVPLFAAFIIITSLGLIDDFISIRPLYKLMVQIGAGFLIALSGFNLHTLYIPLMEQPLSLGPFSYVITCFWIVGMSNAVNLVDGIDGLAGGITAIAALFFGIISLIQGDITTALIALTLFGSIIGFLVYNFPPAKLFMGDSGSLFLGFTIAVIPLLKNNSSHMTTVSLITMLTLMIIPFLDTVSAILRRIRRKRPVHSPDKDHLHHKLLFFGLSTEKILIVVYSLSVFVGLTQLTILYFSNKIFFTILVTVWVLFISFFIIIDRFYRAKYT
jgi:UDP-GlcNAc:undecaprenyl-phosphate GlcNAc-1-phosphate transferase